MSKLIFLDIDGTLVNYENHLPASAARAVTLARKNGHRIVLCTGRSRAEIQPEQWGIEIDGLIGGNGSYVEYQNQVRMHQLIPEAVAHRVVDWLQTRQLAFFLESNNGLFASPDFEARAEPVMAIYTARKGQKPVSVREVMPGLRFNGELYRHDLNKISFILERYQDHLDSAAAFPELKAGTWGGVGETALFGDLGVKAVDKGGAVSLLIHHLNFSPEHTLAFGDAKIDIPMLQACAIGVAMGNGGEEIKAIADYITADVNADGLWQAFQHFHLI